VSFIFRISPKEFSPHDPGGSFIVEGRWHPVGIPILYYCSSLPACIIERRVNGVEFEIIRTLYHYGKVDVDISIAEVVPDSFYSADWVAQKNLTQQFGEEWLKSKRSLLLAVRCAPIPTETNYLINPAHPDFGSLSFSAPSPVLLDPRIK
jgi:RES domain-containing protein